jgi:hypothetical protein
MVYMQLCKDSHFFQRSKIIIFFPTKIQGNARITSEKSKCMEHVHIVGLLSINRSSLIWKAMHVAQAILRIIRSIITIHINKQI